MKLGLLFLIVSFWSLEIDTRSIYDALDGQSLEKVVIALRQLDKEPSTSRVKAFRGVLLAKKAFFLDKISDKVSVFKEGAFLLESEIASYPDNVEYRFLRLATQENSPGILGYKNNLEEDKSFIIKKIESMDSDLRDQVYHYSKTSIIIPITDLP
ncbi:MAG: hypothetical protein OCD76_03695 [Reichenbachiella sp.]